ncbi:hypothetical protein [Flavobacterium gelatinilyticum]|uniref:hypothetical protein n=1 Tax=Flavobacterium gelatinilyticum TaxID=3003260 RepID=UPI0024800C2A|nr:hypothetical protein [Flavobacterium gelatinilyticum]
MREIAFFAALSILFSGCSGQKSKEPLKPNSISWDYTSKNYFNAFNNSVTVLKNNPSGEKRNVALSIIENAYNKYLEEEETALKYSLKTQNKEDYSRLNLENNALKDTYKRSLRLEENYNYLQKQLQDITPLYFNNKELVFPVKEYSELILQTKNNYSDFLYRAANSRTSGLTNSVSRDEKNSYREAYDIYVMLQDFDNAYKRAEIIKLKDEAYKKGQNYISVQVTNSLKSYKGIEKTIPDNLKLGRWITIGKDNKGKYDFNFIVNVEELTISKGDLQRTIFDKEKEILTHDRRRIIKSRLEIVDLHKEAYIKGSVKATDNFSKKTNTALLEVPAIYDYSFAIQDGDIRAVEERYLRLLDNIPSNLPSDNEMFKMGLERFTEKVESEILNRIVYRE